MKKVFSLFLVFSALSGAAILSAEQWLVLGFDDWPPFTGRAGTPRVAVQLLTRALERLNYKVDMIPLRQGQFSRVFTDDQIQISPALWHDPSRENIFIYSKPIFENRLMLAGRSGSEVENLSLGDLAGKKLGVVEGYAYGEKLTSSPAELVMGKSDQDNMKKLQKGEVDYILISELLMIYAKRSRKWSAESNVEVGKVPQITREIHFAVKKTTPDAAKIVKQLDREIEKMKEDGSYYEILGINRIMMDVNGDGKPEMVLLGDPARTLNPEEVYWAPGTLRDVPDADKNQWYMVDGKFYKTLEEIPGEKRKKMNRSPEKQVQYAF